MNLNDKFDPAKWEFDVDSIAELACNKKTAAEHSNALNDVPDNPKPQSETDSEQVADNNKNKSKKIRIFLAVALLIVLIAIMFASQFYGWGGANAAVLSSESLINTSNTTALPQTTSVNLTGSTTSVANQMPITGECGKKAMFKIEEDKTPGKYKLSFFGSGKLWNINNLDFRNVALSSIKSVIVCGDVEIDEDYLCPLENVTYIKFSKEVTHICKYACVGLPNLKKVVVENSKCKIDYFDEKYIYLVFGDAEKIVCKKGSTAEECAEAWNACEQIYDIIYL